VEKFWNHREEWCWEIYFIKKFYRALQRLRRRSIKFGRSIFAEVGTGFNGEMTGRENIYLNGAILGMTKKEIASKIDEIIEFSGCERYIDTP
jgi:ABC-type Na+ transport system ATPase subunit NatA